MKLEHLIRPDLICFQPQASTRTQNMTGVLRLNANESPWSQSLPENSNIFLNRYPDSQPRDLIEKLADFYQTLPETMLITRGSDEGIDLLIKLCCTAGQDSILICPPTFDMYQIRATLQGASTLSVPLKRAFGFQLDLPAILKAWNPCVKIIFLCSPNNPTGNLLNEKEILTLCQTVGDKSLVVLDEAYIEYTQQKSMIQNISQYPNLVILRTFSKALGLAGIRCGTLIGNEHLITWLNKITMPYPISVLTEQVALKALEKASLQRINGQVQIIQAEREKLRQYFENHPAIQQVWPSEANFLLVTVNAANRFVDFCLKNGVLLRRIPDQNELAQAVRISIGLPNENAQLMKILENYTV